MHIYASQEKEGLDKKISRKFRGFLSGFRRNGPKSADDLDFSRKNGWSLVGEAVLVACIFSLYAGSAAPEVNESHYLTKAKHFWDPHFAARDLFIASADAHWFFFATIGWLTHVWSLPVAAWCGRILGWLAMALGWCLFMRRIFPLQLAGALTAPLWIASLHWGQLSGEWIVGGCEAKVFAYALSFIGLSEIVSQRWSRAWYWFGLAAAFHVLTGGWITLAALLSYLLLRVWGGRADPGGGSQGRPLEWLRYQWLGLVVGGCLSLLGLIPAILLNRGIDAATSERGAMIYVFQRLPHHLSPLRFASERWYCYAGMMAITFLMAGSYWRSSRTRLPPSVFRPLILIASMVSLIALMGVFIDGTLSSWATNWSAGLLRFYWFRWNDVVWPTLLVIFVYALAKPALADGARGSSPGPHPIDEDRGVAAEQRSLFSGGQGGVRWLAILLLAVPGPLLIMDRYLDNHRAILAPADRASLVMRTETVAMQKQVRDDWLDVCYWTRTNTPQNALFLTPRFQQTFKWYAHRAEVACWKDAPQDAVGLIEWERRLLEIFPRSAEGYGIPMTDQHLREMRLRYKIDFVILDRRIQKQPPLLPLVHSNNTYAVFEFP